MAKKSTHEGGQWRRHPLTSRWTIERRQKGNLLVKGKANSSYGGWGGCEEEEANLLLPPGCCVTRHEGEVRVPAWMVKAFVKKRTGRASGRIGGGRECLQQIECVRPEKESGVKQLENGERLKMKKGPGEIRQAP